MGRFAVKLSTPTSVDIAMTRKCNHKCIHCYNTWRADECPEGIVLSMTDEQVKKITDELVANDVWRATITGGEPLSDISVLYKLIRSLSDKGILLGMNTNLSLMTDEIASELTDKYGWDNILLTSLPGLTPEICDSVTQVPGSYGRISAGIDTCERHGIPVGINIVVSKKNMDQLERLPEYLKQHKVDYVSITRAIAPLYDRDNPAFFLTDKEILRIADVLESVHREFGVTVGSVTPFPLCILKDIAKYQDITSASCAAGISRCCIDAVTGDITACTHEKDAYGNIYTDGLKAAWDKMNGWREGTLVNDECKDCKHLSYCGGECRMIAGTEKNVRYHLDKNADITYTPYKPIHPILDDTEFTVSKNVRYRREPFGGILRCEDNECYVAESIITLYEHIKDLSKVTISNFTDICVKNQYLYDAMAELEKMRILRRI